MKKMSFIFAIFILGLLFQNSYSEEVRYAHTDSSNASLVLWKIHTTSGLNDRIYMTVDSVIKGNYYAKAQWTPYIYGQYKKNMR